jgi:hypothetical protein
MTDLVIQNDVRDWRRRFLLLEVPRQLRFNLNQAGWEVELQRFFALHGNRGQAVMGDNELSDEEGGDDEHLDDEEVSHPLKSTRLILHYRMPAEVPKAATCRPNVI